VSSSEVLEPLFDPLDLSRREVVLDREVRRDSLPLVWASPKRSARSRWYSRTGEVNREGMTLVTSMDLEG
jgi:hypothetical protein